MEFAGREVRVERKPYRRTISVQVRPCGEVVVHTLQGTSEWQIRKVLGENEKWLRKHVERAERIRERYPKVNFVNGEQLPILGRRLELRLNFAERIRFDVCPGELLAYLPEVFGGSREYRKKAFQAFYKKEAKRILEERVDVWSSRMQLIPKKLSLRCQSSLWGSCSSENHVSLNWKLIVFPLEIVDYVVIHELAHIRHRNHSKVFWRLVEQFDPQWKAHRHFLSQNQFAVDFLSKRSELYP